jgi:hypothetical protein
MLPFLAICGTWFHGLYRGQHDFWDARTYDVALARVHAGENPYDLTAPTFVYPPIFLKCATPLSHVFPGRPGWYLYVLLACAAVCALPWILATTYIRSRWLTPAVAMLLFTFQPRLFGEIALLTGNFGVLLHVLVLASGIPGIRRNEWLPFYVTVILAGLIKPPFLGLLLLPLLAGRRQAWQSALSAVVVFVGYALQKLLLPASYRDFEASVRTKIVTQQDAGLGIYGYLMKLGHRISFLSGSGSVIAHTCIIGAMVVVLFLQRRVTRLPGVANLWVPVVLVLAVLANPRLEAYEITIGVVPAIYICTDSILAYPPHRSRAAVIAASLSAFAALLSEDGTAAPCLLLLSAVLICLYRFGAALRQNQPSQPLPGELTLPAQNRLIAD